IPMTGSPRAQTCRADRARPQPGTSRPGPQGPISQCSIHVLDIDLVALEVVARGLQARVEPGVLVDKHAGSGAVFDPAVLEHQMPGHVDIRRPGMIAPTIGHLDVAKHILPAVARNFYAAPIPRLAAPATDDYGLVRRALGIERTTSLHAQH